MVNVSQRPGELRANRSVLTINSGSSSIKFGLFTLEPEPKALCRGALDQPERATVVEQLIARVAEQFETYPLAGVGHRVVHGGPALRDPQIVTGELIETLRTAIPFAPNHLPDEIQLIENVRRLRPDTQQMVCFDTAFHAGLPDVASRLPIPRRYADEGVRRYGFHGLSYTFLMDELRRRTPPSRSDGRVVLAHLGSGSSLAAVRNGQSIDTSMGLTPIGGVVMSTRSGDLDPGVVTYMARSSGLEADRLESELSHRSGLAGISDGIADMRELLAREAADESSRLAASIYCYEIKSG